MQVSWSIGGTAGEGLETAGELLAQALARAGHRPVTQRDFPSRIRGGDTTSTVRIAPGGYLAPASCNDIALAFNDTVLDRMRARLGKQAVLILDEGVEVAAQPAVGAPARDARGPGGADQAQGVGPSQVTFPFTRLAKENGAPRGKNMVALGVTAWMLAIDPALLRDAVEAQFDGKGSDVVAKNIAALDAGHAHAQTIWAQPGHALAAVTPTPVQWLSGNEAVALGALAAGCRVAAAYPITPASDILEFMTPHLERLGGIAVQMEDEMAALQVCIGAGFTGARALTATSGPGLSLMTESLGFAASAEVPCVIVDCQRPGPSTGMPTKHGQEDILHMVYGGHGEDVRIVIAPVDVEDAFHATSEAFRLSQIFLAPALVAMDQQLSLFKQAVAPLSLQDEAARHGARGAAPAAPGSHAWDGSYLAYGDDGGPARRALPGEEGRHYSNSTEHGPSGFTTEDPKARRQMVERRARRMEHIVEACDRPVMAWGPDEADVTLVACGSTVGACREAADLARGAGIGGVRVVAARLLRPLPVAALGPLLQGRLFVVEANAHGQLATILKAALPIHDRLRSVLRYDGAPVEAEEILEHIRAQVTA